MIPASHLHILTTLCNAPVAPYAEQHALAIALQWAQPYAASLNIKRDPAGNLYLHYRNGPPIPTPLVIEAHLDHPGFLTTSDQPDTHTLQAQFRGGVKPSCFTDARAKFWLNDPPVTGRITPTLPRGQWLPTRVLNYQDAKPFPLITLEKPPIDLHPNSIGMWDLPDSGVTPENLFTARVCDDLAGAAAALCTLQDLIEQQAETDVTVLLTRAEEVGFAGVLAVAQNNWLSKDTVILGLETSKALPTAAQGDGPVIRVGDRMATFAAGLTHFVSQCAGHLSDADPTFKSQRKLMDAGTCNTTPFVAYGYDATGLCLPLGNYHNMHLPNDPGFNQAPTAGPHIASETIHLNDFHHLTRLLIQTALRLPTYQKNFGAAQSRFNKLHAEEQRDLLYATSDTFK